MRSSTSSSEPVRPIPARPWAAVWIAALALTGLCLAGWETAWRARGFRPTIADSPLLWSEARARASTGDPGTVAFVGSSLVQAAIDLGAFADATNGLRPVQLGISGSPSLAILEDLASDDDFVGVVVAEHLAAAGLGEGLARAMLAFRARSRTSPSDWAEHRLRTPLQARVVFRQSAVAPLNVGRRWALGQHAIANRVVVTPERSIWIHPTSLATAPGVVAHNRRWQAAPPIRGENAGRSEENVARLEAAVSSIRARGGEVVLVYFTCSGPERAQTEERHDRVWEALLQRSSAVLVDLREHLDAAEIPCSDGAHVDAVGKEPLTRALARALEESTLRERR